MMSRRYIDQPPIQPGPVERAEPEPRWIPESELRSTFPTGQRIRQYAKEEAVKLEVGEKYKPKTKPKHIEFGDDDLSLIHISEPTRLDVI
eukprot:12931743-Prorocentrum_lima.AAC.1